MKKKIKDPELEEAILFLLGDTNRALSISEIKKTLDKVGIKRSPQVIYRHLKTLKKKKKILEEKNGKT